jgi:hypothetical protein
MTFLEAVNRVLRLEGIIMGDDDDLTSFTDSQHAATSSLAQISIQAQLADLISDGYIPYENAVATITTSADTRTYALATNFQRFQELFMERLNALSEAEGSRVFYYKGGESQLRKDDPQYRETQGNPICFYPVGATSKTIGLWPVPEETVTYRYYYEADVAVSVVSDSLPFVTATEAQTFVRMAARHFKYLKATPQVREGLFPKGIESDPVILQCRSTLMGLLYPLPDKTKYGKYYG